MVTARHLPFRFVDMVTARRTRRLRLCWMLCVLTLAMAGRGLVEPAVAQAPVVYVIPIDGVIDLGLAPFVERTLTEAATQQAAAVVLEINTFGGRVDAAVLIRDALLRTPVRTIAFKMRARVVEAEAEVPRAMAEAFRQGRLGVMDYYRMKNVQADTTVRDAIARGDDTTSPGPKTQE